jgi:hypothetical protein
VDADKMRGERRRKGEGEGIKEPLVDCAQIKERGSYLEKAKGVPSCSFGEVKEFNVTVLGRRCQNNSIWMEGKVIDGL